MAQYHRRLLAQARAAGNADSSERVLGENLAVISYTWLAECSAEQQVMDQIVGTTTLYNFATGITAQAKIQQTGIQGPYVDLPVNRVFVTSQSSGGPTTTVGGFGYPTAIISTFLSYIEAASAFESAALEQTQAPVPGMIAASTVRVVDANMNPAYPGELGTTYLADGTTTAGQSQYTSTIEPAINSHYVSTDLTNISAAVSAGKLVLISENGQVGIGLWLGAGYTVLWPRSAGLITVGQLITGGMSGGFSGTQVVDPAANRQITLTPPASTDSISQLINPTPAPANPRVSEPVDGVSGAYVYEHDDLLTGGGSFPYALPFSRTYSSASGSYLTTTTADSGIGNGWNHNYGASAAVESDPYTGIGSSDSPAISAAGSIAALYVLQDLLSVTPTPQTLTLASMVAQWFTDQLTSNAVLVAKPDTIEEFMALPHADGSTRVTFNPPPGSSVLLTQVSPGQFSYTRKDQVMLNFGPSPAGALQGWVYPNGISVTLAYSGSQLASVSNNLGRRLSFSYSGNNITSVTDDSGRRVA